MKFRKQNFRVIAMRFSAATVSLWAIIGCGASAPTKPSVLFYLVDDLGHYNVHFGGSVDPHNPDMKTPVIEGLVSEGLILQRHYVYRYCSPTRTSLLSGRLPIHANEMNYLNFQPGGGLAVEFATLADKFSALGYYCAAVGKWHLGLSTESHLPVNRGFNVSLGYLGGGEDHFTQEEGSCPGVGPTIDLWDTETFSPQNGTYGAYLYTAAASDAINHAADVGVPFFVYFAAQNVHAPFQAPERFLRLYDDCEWCTKSGKTVFAMVSAMDESLGNVTTTIRDRGLWDNTLVIFSADNGGDPAKNNYPFRGGKYSDFEGGVRAAAFLAGGVLPPSLHGKAYAGIIHVCDWYSTVLTLAGASPELIRADRGPGIPPLDSIDVWPAIVSNATSPRVVVPLSSAHGPPGWGAMSETGPCIVPGQLTGANARCSQGAIIVGDWKLYYGPYTNDSLPCFYCWWTPAQYPSKSHPTNTDLPFSCGPGGCLYDLATDPYERTDLAAARPDKLAELTKAFNEAQATVWWSTGGAENRSTELCQSAATHGNHVAPYGDPGTCPNPNGCM